MKFKKNILTIVLLSILLNSSGQALDSPLVHLYSVDKQVDLQLKKFPRVDTGILKNSMTIKVFWDANTFFNQSLDCITKSLIRNDTILIMGHMPGELGYGFELVLFKDSCIIVSFGLSDGKIYKYNESDTISTDFISLSSISQKLVLSKKPLFQKGEIVSGVVKLKSIPFYYTEFKGRFRIELVAYFKTAPLDAIW